MQSLCNMSTGMQLHPHGLIGLVSLESGYLWLDGFRHERNLSESVFLVNILVVVVSVLLLIKTGFRQFLFLHFI